MRICIRFPTRVKHRLPMNRKIRISWLHEVHRFTISTGKPECRTMNSRMDELWRYKMKRIHIIERVGLEWTSLALRGSASQRIGLVES